MKRSKFVFAILFSTIVLSATFVIVAIGNDTKGEVEVSTYDIPIEYLAETNKQVKVLDGDTLIFGSSGEENTVISAFTVSSGAIKQKATLGSSTYNSIAVDNNGKTYITYPHVTGQENHLAIYDVDNNKNCATKYYFDQTDGFEFDNENNLYILSRPANAPVELNKCQLQEDRSSLVCKNISTYVDNNGKNILSLSKGAGDSEIYLTLIDGVYSFKTNNAAGQLTNFINKLLNGEFNSTNLVGLKSIANNFVIDNSCMLYSSKLTTDRTSTDSIEKQYKTFASNMDLVSCSAAGDIIICIDDVIYLLDANGTATAQCELENTPENIFCMGDSIVAVSFEGFTDAQDNKYSAKVNVISLSQLKAQKNIQYVELQQADNAFTAEPVNEVKLDALKDSQMWEISINTKDISMAKRGMPTVEITDIDTNEVYIRSNSLNNLNISEDESSVSFTPPESIEAHEYQVLLKDAVNTDGIPICLKYTVHIVDENEDISDELIESEVYYIDRNLKTINGVSPGTTVSQLKSKLKYNGDLTVKSMQGNILSSGTVGNASTVELSQNSNLIASLVIIVYGDIDGGGKLDSKDVRRCCDYVLGIDNLNEWQSLAMDVNHDGQSDIVDLVIINGCLNGKYSIEQK